jgi:hypothetical protein
MTDQVGRLERRLFQQHWDDGLLDVFSGVGAIGLGVCWVLDLVAFGAVVPALLAPFWAPLRRKLVEPRAGLVEFSDERVARSQRWLAGSALVGIAVLAATAAVGLWIAPDAAGVLPMIAPALPALLVGLLAAIASLMLGLPRFLVYAACFGAAGLGVAVTNGRPEAAIIGGGLLVLASGAWRIARFLRLDVEAGEAG